MGGREGDGERERERERGRESERERKMNEESVGPQQKIKGPTKKCTVVLPFVFLVKCVVFLLTS